MNIFKTLSFYTLISIGNQAVSFFLLPVLTKYLSPKEYGIISIFMAFISFTSPLIVFGIPTLIGIDFFKEKHNRLKEILSSLFFLSALLALIIIIIFIFIGPYFVKLFHVPYNWLVSVPLFVFLTVVPQSVSVLLRSKNKPFQFALFESPQSILKILLSIILVVHFDLHWQGRLYSLLITNVLFFILGIFILYKMNFMSMKIRFNKIIEGLKFGAGLIPHSTSNQLIRMSDRLFIVSICGPTAAGMYAVGWQIASIVLVLLNAFNLAWAPYLFEKLSKQSPHNNIILVKNSYYVILLFLVFIIGLNFISPIIYKYFVDPKYYESIKFVKWLSIGFFFASIYLTVIDYIFYEKKAYLLSTITTVNLAIHASLNYVLVHKYGPIGASYAFAITMFVVMCLAFITSYKVHSMPWLFFLKKRNIYNRNL